MCKNINLLLFDIEFFVLPPGHVCYPHGNILWEENEDACQLAVTALISNTKTVTKLNSPDRQCGCFCKTDECFFNPNHNCKRGMTEGAAPICANL